MSSLTIEEAHKQFPELIEKVNNGEVFVIEDKDFPVAAIVPAQVLTLLGPGLQELADKMGISLE